MILYLKDDAKEVLFKYQETQNGDHKNSEIDGSDYEEKCTNDKLKSFGGVEDDIETKDEANIKEKMKHCMEEIIMLKNKNEELKGKLKICEEKDHELEEKGLAIANMKEQLD